MIRAYTCTTYMQERGSSERVKHAARTVWEGKGWNKAVGLRSGVQGRVVRSPRKIKYYNRTHAISPIAGGRSVIKCKI